MFCVRLRNGQELVCLSATTGSRRGRSGGGSSSMRLQMFGTNLLQRAEWQGCTAFLLGGWQNKTALPGQRMLPPTGLS